MGTKYRRLKRTRRQKRSMWRTVKGVVYVGAIAAPIVNEAQKGGGFTAASLTNVAKRAAFMDPGTGGFSLEAGARIWGPVAFLAVADFASSKLGIQRRIAQGVSNIGL